MSFYDEFLKSLEEDSDETAIEGLETDVVDEESESEKDEENDMVSEDIDEALEAYQSFNVDLHEKMYDDVAPVLVKYIEGETGVEAFIEGIDNVINDIIDLSINPAIEGIGSKIASTFSTRARADQERLAIKNEDEAVSNYELFVKKMDSFNSKYKTHCDRVFSMSPETFHGLEYKGNLAGKVGVAAIKAKTAVKQNTVTITVGATPYNKSSYNKLLTKGNSIARNKDVFVKGVLNGSISADDLRIPYILESIGKKCENYRSLAKKASDAVAAGKKKLHTGMQNLRVDVKASGSETEKYKKAQGDERKEASSRATQLFKEAFKETGKAVKSGLKQINPTVRFSKFAQERKKGRYAHESWTAIESLESYDILWDVNPEVASAFEAYISEVLNIDEAISEAYEAYLIGEIEADWFDFDAAVEGFIYADEVIAELALESLVEDEEVVEEPESPLEEEVEETSTTEEPVEKVQESETEVEESTTPAEESLEREVSDEEMLTSGMESILFLEALRATCASEDEYKQIITENATELQLYGVVDPVAIARESWSEDDEEVDEEVATEAKNIVRLNKQARVNTEVARMSIGLAKKANDPLYKAYHKHSVLKRKFRDKIYAKYNSRATPLARKAVANGRNRAAMINSPAGAGIVSKIDSRLKQLDKSARNMSAIKKDTAPSKPSMGRMNK